jgi:hypothetical protein
MFFIPTVIFSSVFREEKTRDREEKMTVGMNHLSRSFDLFSSLLRVESTVGIKHLSRSCVIHRT